MDHLTAFMIRERMASIGPAKEVFESAHRCDCCGGEHVGERYEVQGVHAERQDTLTFFFCTPCIRRIA